MNRLKLILNALILAIGIQFSYPIQGEYVFDHFETSTILAVETMSVLILCASMPPATGYGFFDKYIVPFIQKNYYKKLYILDELVKDSHWRENPIFIKKDAITKKYFGSDHTFLETFPESQKSTLATYLSDYEQARDKWSDSYDANLRSIYEKKVPRTFFSRLINPDDMSSDECKQSEIDLKNAASNLLAQIETIKTQLKPVENPKWLQWLPTAGAIAGTAATALITYFLLKESSIRSFSEFIDALAKYRVYRIY